MLISTVDVFYLAMPEITRAADGTQDSFLVRVRSDDGLEGWGESDASPLVSAAVYCCPPSHGNIVNIRESLLGERVEGVGDILRLHDKVLRNALDIQHVHHAYSGADIALWDLLGKRLGLPVYKLLDGPEAEQHPKTPYASVLFPDSPQETKERAAHLRRQGFAAGKFGWGPIGRFGRENDVSLVRAAREGLGADARLFVDAGVAWGTDDETAYRRACDIAPYRIGWLEEPLLPDAVEAYARLCARRPPVPIAAGEGSGRRRDAEDLISNGGVDLIQIDAGRIGGITVAHQVRRLAEERGRTYVNHTFKSHLSLAAAMHVFAAHSTFDLVEYPVGGSAMARELTTERLERRPDGRVLLPETPGLGFTVNLDTLRQYLCPVRIEVSGSPVFHQGAL